MKSNKILNRKILNKCFSKLSTPIRTILLSILFDVAEQKDYLENRTTHTDAIGWHLNEIKIFEFREMLDSYFESVLKLIRKLVTWDKITIAFDETYIAYYGKKWSIWIHSYKNKVKGATGSYKFMVCSIVLGEKRFVLYALPMRRGESG